MPLIRPEGLGSLPGLGMNEVGAYDLPVHSPTERDALVHTYGLLRGKIKLASQNGRSSGSNAGSEL